MKFFKIFQVKEQRYWSPDLELTDELNAGHFSEIEIRRMLGPSFDRYPELQHEYKFVEITPSKSFKH